MATKISNYKNYLTLNGTTIDTPHDYTDVDVATIYTATRDDKSKIEENKIWKN